MKYLKLLELAIKYLIRYRRRYLFLFVALGFGFSLITFITSLKDGMTENVYNIAQSHYAGDLIITALDKDYSGRNKIIGESTGKVTEIIRDSGLNPSRVVYRTNEPNDGVIYFNGAASRLKYVIGVDWENEQEYFSNVTYAAPPEKPLAGDDTIVISAPVAELLGLRLGDSVILEVSTVEGYRNTAVFVVRAIIEDATIFGYYKVYVSRKVLNHLIGFDDNGSTTIGLFFSNRSAIPEKQRIMKEKLSGFFDVGPLVADREEFAEARRGQWEGARYFILTIAVYLSEVGELLQALNMISYFLYIVMLLIIFVSASVTYRLILHERTREIGTMRALGFYGTDIRVVLLMEALCLIILSLAAGFILAAAAGYGISFMKFTSIPSFEIFTKNGRLMPQYFFRTIGTNVIAVMCIFLPAVWFPVYISSRNPLPEMLSGGMKA